MRHPLIKLRRKASSLLGRVFWYALAMKRKSRDTVLIPHANFFGNRMRFYLMASGRLLPRMSGLPREERDMVFSKLEFVRLKPLQPSRRPRDRKKAA